MNPDDLNMNETSLSEFGAGTDPNEPAALPLGAGGFEAQADPLVGIEEGGNRSRANQLLIVLVVVVAAAGLFFMRTLAKVTLAAVSVDDERLLQEFLDERNEKSPAEGIADLRETSLAVLNDPYPELQRPLESLQKNPFTLTVEHENVQIPENIDNGERQFVLAVRAKEQAFEQAISRLQLKSVLGGSNPVANISGNIVRTGDTVTQEGVTFLVKQITTETAVLEAREDALALIRKYTLEIERP